MEEVKKNKKEPKVTVFGNDVREDEDGSRYYGPDRHKRGGLVFGFLLILAGIIFLFNTLGILPWSVWGIVGRLWPVLLILIGIDIIFGHSWVSELFTFVLTFGVCAIVLGLIFLKVSPSTLAVLPTGVTDFLTAIGSYLQIR